VYQRQHKELFTEKTEIISDDKNLFDPTPLLMEDNHIIGYYRLIEDKNVYEKEKTYLEKLKFKLEERSHYLYKKTIGQNLTKKPAISSTNYLRFVLKESSANSLINVNKENKENKASLLKRDIHKESKGRIQILYLFFINR